jgi:DNA-binding NarL/FixJ family response regulator
LPRAIALPKNQDTAAISNFLRTVAEQKKIPAPVHIFSILIMARDFSKIGGIDPAGRAFFISTVGGKLCAAIMHRPTKFSDIAERFAALSDRQRQVAALVCDGLSNRVIAEKLGLTEGTVKVHLHAIYKGLGIESRIARLNALSDGRSPSPASGPEQGRSQN